MHRISVLTLIMTIFSFSPSFSQPNFERHNIHTDLRGAYWVYAKDIDLDGDLDLLTAAYDGIDWWQNNGSQSFSKKSVDKQMVGAWSAHADDMDNDGDIDILASSPTDDEVVLWLNDGSQNFNTRIVLDDTGLDPETVITEDLDGDGDRDILVAHWESLLIVWYENKGDLEFVRHTIDNNLRGAHSVATGDFDGDGDLDVVANGSSDTNWYHNPGNENFTRVPLSGSGGLVIYTADLDNDGDIDILRNQRSSGDVLWYQNQGNAVFVSKTIAAEYGDSWSIRAGDIDGDGDLDVAAAGFSANNIAIWLNQGGATFGQAIIVDDTVVKPRFVQIADLDGDGDGDIIAALRDDRTLAWYEVLGSPPPAKSLTVTAPAPGDTLLAQTSYAIKWSSTGQIDNVKIEFSSDNGQSWNILGQTANTGVLNWNVPNLTSETCLIRISGTGVDEPSDQTDDIFAIFREQDLPQTLQVLSPNGGEQFYTDSTYAITWQSTGPVTAVKIELSVNNGTQWSTIISQTPNTGSYQWQVPQTPSDVCLIRVSNAGNASVLDVSDAVFAITEFVVPPTLTVVTPAGGESLWADSLFTITWTSTGEISDVRIEFSSDNGATWSTVTGNTPNTASYEWQLPDVSSNLCRIRLADAADGDPLSSPSAVFTIHRITELAPIILSFSPESGVPGTPVTITGQRFSDVSAVAFNGRAAEFTLFSDDRLEAIVPNGATSGPISVSNFAGSGTSSSAFQVKAGNEVVVLSFPPSHDAQIKYDDPASNYGDKTTFKAEKDIFASYLKFDVAGLSGTILNAGLRLRVNSPSDFGGDIFRAGNNFSGSGSPWTESDLTAANAPVVTSEVIDSLQAVETGETVEFDLSSQILANGTFSFAIISRSGDQVEYESKESGFSPELVVVIERAINIPPFAEDDFATVPEDESIVIPVSSNDADSDGQLNPASVMIKTAPKNGSATALANGSISYRPKPNYFGTDSLFYSIADDAGSQSNLAAVRITISPENDAPVAVADTKIALVAESIAISVLENDFDIDSEIDVNSIQITRSPASQATVQVQGSQVLYMPPLNFAGVDSFAYTVKDDSGAVSNEANVRLILQDGNQPPVAVNDTVMTALGKPVNIDVAGNDRDPEGHLDLLAVAIVDAPVNGEAGVNVENGSIDYVPAADFEGTDSFTYRIQDVFGLQSNTATVFVRVAGVNNPPVIQTFSPTDLQLSYKSGQVIDFMISPKDEDSDQLGIVWTVLNVQTEQEVEVATDSHFTMNTSEFEPSGYDVKVTVSDGLAEVAQEWHLDITTSVALGLFQASYVDFDGIKLVWQTASESANAGFNVLRSRVRDGEYTQLNETLVPLSPTRLYDFYDRKVEKGGTYYYKLEDVSVTGEKTLHGPIRIDVSAPKTFEISHNYPNPFNPETHVRLTVPHTGRVIFFIYDLLGKQVQKVLDEPKEPGFYVLTWSGQDDQGHQVASGTYYYRLTFEGKSFTGKMTLLR